MKVTAVFGGMLFGLLVTGGISVAAEPVTTLPGEFVPFQGDLVPSLANLSVPGASLVPGAAPRTAPGQFMVVPALPNVANKPRRSVVTVTLPDSAPEGAAEGVLEGPDLETGAAEPPAVGEDDSPSVTASAPDPEIQPESEAASEPDLASEAEPGIAGASTPEADEPVAEPASVETASTESVSADLPSDEATEAEATEAEATEAEAESGAPTLATLMKRAERVDPFGDWLAADVAANASGDPVASLLDPGAASEVASLAGQLTPLAEAPRADEGLATSSPATGSPTWGLLPSREADSSQSVTGGQSLGTALAEMLARASGAGAEGAGGFLPDWSVSSFEFLQFDIAGLLDRMRKGLFGATGSPDPVESMTAEAPRQPAEPAPVPGAAVPPLERPVARSVAPAGRILELDERGETATAALEALPEGAAPEEADLTERGPRSLGVVNMSKLIATEPAPEFKVVAVTPDSLDRVLRARGPAAASPASPSASPSSEDLARARSRAEAEREDLREGEGPGVPSVGLAALIPPSRPAREPKGRGGPKSSAGTAKERVVARLRASPPPPRLRPFDAASHGIRVIPGSSAASLARMLESVSTRPAGSGFGPVLTAAERRMSFDQLLTKADAKSGFRSAPGLRREKAKKRSKAATLMTGARNLRTVLTTEGAYLD